MWENIEYQAESKFYEVVWFNEKFSDFKNSVDASIRARSLKPHVKTFFDPEECWNFIHDTNVDYLFFIMPFNPFSSVDNEILTRANALLQVSFIYLLSTVEICNDQVRYFERVRHICSSEDILIEKLYADVRDCKENSSSSFSLLEIGQSTHNLTKASGAFIWRQLYLEALFHTFDGEQAKLDMVEYCRNYYADDKAELDKISYFELNYRSDDAIKWYTRDSFLYRLLNRTLRSENIDDIYKFRFILSELYTRLIELHCDYLQTLLDLDLIPYTLTVYRGQLIAPQELDRLKRSLGSLIAMNTFLSTSFDQSASLMFAGNGQRRPNYESVLFAIDIDTSTTTTPFADIDKYSWNNSEQEILILVGAMFKIMNIQYENNVWIIKLQTCDSQHIRKLQEHYYPKLLNEFNTEAAFYICMVNYYTVMADIKRSNSYLKEFYRLDNSNSPLTEIQMRKMAVFNSEMVIKVREQELALTTDQDMRLSWLLRIAQLHIEDNNFMKAIECIEQCRPLVFGSFRPLKLLHLANFLETLGLLCDGQEKHEEALKLFEIMLRIYTAYLPSIALEIANAHDIIGMTHFYLGSYSDAILHFNYSLDIYRQCLPLEHFSIGDCYQHMGLVYFRSGCTIQAKRCYDSASELYEKCSQTNPARMGKIYHCQAHLYAVANNNEEALHAYQKAEQIYRSFLPHDHCFFAGLYSDLGELHNCMNDLDQALQYLNTALMIESNHNPCQKTRLLGTLHLHIGRNYFMRGSYSTCLNNFSIAAVIFQRHLPLHNETFQEILHYIARAYYRLNKYEESLANYKLLLNLDMPIESETAFEIFYSIGRLFLKMKQPKEALEYFEACLNLSATIASLFSNDRLLHVYRYQGLAFFRLKEYSHALDSFNHALTLCTTIKDFVVTYNELRKLYHVQRNFELELYYARLVLDKSMEDPQQCEFILGHSYLNIGQAYFHLYEYEKALPFLHKSKEIFDPLEDRVNISNAVEYIAVSYYQIDNYEQAELFTLQRLELLRRFHQNNESSPDFPYAYSRLARIKCEQKCYNEAEELSEKALCLRREYLSENDIRLGVSFQTFGIVCNAQEKYEEALDYFEKFEKILRTTKESDHPYHTYLHENLGTVYYNMKQFTKSREHYEKSLTFALEKYPLHRRFHQRLKYGIERIFDHFF
ncbi:unnamed protein product [Rotaria socialis]